MDNAEKLQGIQRRYRKSLAELETLEDKGYESSHHPSSPDIKTIELIKHYMKVGCATNACLQRIFRIDNNALLAIAKEFKQEEDI